MHTATTNVNVKVRDVVSTIYDMSIGGLDIKVDSRPCRAAGYGSRLYLGLASTLTLTLAAKISIDKGIDFSGQLADTVSEPCRSWPMLARKGR